MSNIFEESIFASSLDQIIMDYDMEGSFDENGQVTRVYSEDALSQAIMIWLRLRKGEMMRRPLLGGYIYPYLNKSLSDENAIGIKEAILQGLENDFRPYVTVNKLSVTPDYDNKTYVIYIQVQTTNYKIISDVEDEIEVRGS